MNWRRLTPPLETGVGGAMQMSAAADIMVAHAVLLATAVLGRTSLALP